ncbi:trace amine-associated receptor 13c-like [Stegastes partitus]|uniref:Trace amine-associated receptor 13c-like n=1 Tax=Stegastes partitus TaxID=144197 RepID=A0A3B5A1C5_9TELE|nr:PREDICTED: trace amine-associated receptor 13c-like [Stegastes partitus]
MVETLERAVLCISPLNTSCQWMPGTPKVILIKSLLCCIALLTVIFNLLVVISISHFRQLHTPTNFLILSLAVSDLLVGVAVMPTAIVALQSCWFLGKTTCAYFYLLSFILTSASVGSMVLISVDRYVAICNPLLYSSMITTSRVITALSLCWVCSVWYSFVILKDHFAQTRVSNSCHQECILNIHFISGAVDLMLTFFGPVAVIMVLYMRVFAVAVSHARAMQSKIACVKFKAVAIKKSELRAARSLGVVLLVFILCLFPYYCVSLAVQGNVGANSSAQIWLFYINSTFNPLIYAFFYPWFRRAVTLIVSLQILQPGSRNTKIVQT